MGLFNRKEIRVLNEKIAGLAEELTLERQQVAMLKEECDQLRQKLSEVNSSGRECAYCFSLVSANTRYCPNCGMAVEKNAFPAKVHTDKELFSYENDKDGLLILSYEGEKMKRITIPTIIKGIPVIGVWNEAFKGNEELEEVIFQEGCRYIGNAVFAGCSSLRAVRLPKSLLEIGNEAFSGCENLQDVIIPENVSVLGHSVFYGCTMLKKLILPNKLEYISEQMLCNAGIETIQLPDSVRIIGKKAFMGTHIRRIELPAELEYIFLGAFAMCQNLQSVLIHSNVKRIDPYAFDRIKAMTIYCAEGSVGQSMKFYMKNAVFENISATEKLPDGQIGYQGATLMMDETELKANVCKSETWSWINSTKNSNIDINKYITKKEANRLEKLFADSVVLHSFRD